MRSALTQELSTEEEWQDLISWNDELFDPLFQRNLGITTTSPDVPYGGESFASSTHAPESVSSEQFYDALNTPSLLEGRSSFDYAVSRPPSVTEGHSWLSGSPSYTTSATSPLAAQAGIPYQGSVEACDSMLSPGFGPALSPYIDDQSYGSASSYQTAPTSGLFNPYVAGTPYSFSGLDVYNSQALDNVGTWVEPTIEPIIESHQEDGTGAMPIPIPHMGPQRFTNTFSSHPWNNHSSQDQPRPREPRAITIPQPQIRVSSSPSDFRARHVAMERHPSLKHTSQHSSWRVPPILSVSPEQQRSPRPAILTRSLSNPRRTRNKLASLSPVTDNLGWVSYQPNTQQKLVPSGADGSRRRQRGRVGALTAQQRSHAALMRLVGSCSNCKKRKEKCDPGTPCKSCIDHFKGDLVNHPCRDRLISGLASVFLAERHGWHPTARAIESCVGDYHVVPGTYSIPITFGFGSVLHVPVSQIQFNQTGPLIHSHSVYTWPPDASPAQTRTHAVLPAILTPDAMSTLPDLLDTHLSLLVDQHFRSFPPFCSPLRVLRHIYSFWRTMPPSSPHSRLLQQSLKLLILVHVGGDITLPPPATSPTLTQLIASIPSLPQGCIPTPCLIRAQFGSIMPTLALALMREVLLSLEQLLLNRAPADWPVAVATLIVVLLTVESIQYHSAKIPYHNTSNTNSTSTSTSVSGSGSGSGSAHNTSPDTSTFHADDTAIKHLLEFYARCFGGWHARLHPDWHGDVNPSPPSIILPHTSSSSTSAFPTSSSSSSSPLSPRRPESKKAAAAALAPEDRFVDNVRGAIRAAGLGYLRGKAGAGDRGSTAATSEEGDGDEERDMRFFFDRLAARLVVLGVRGDGDGDNEGEVEGEEGMDVEI